MAKDRWNRLKGPVLRSTALVGLLALSLPLLARQGLGAEVPVPIQRPEPPRTQSTYRTAEAAEELLTEGFLSEPQPYTVHLIQPGESLDQIARRYQVPIALLKELNPGAHRRPLPAGGTLLVVTDPEVLVYETKSGDTIEGIAARYEIGEQDVTRLGTSQLLQIGERLLLRGAKPLVERERVEVASRDAAPRRAPVEAPAPAPERSAPVAAPAPAPAPPVRQGSSGWIWPVQVPILEFTEFAGSSHLGLDMAAAAGTPVLAARSGTVVSAGWHSGYGWNVVVDHGDGIQTRYAHGSELYVSAGEWVEQGQLLLPMGSTGRSTGPHLHFEVIVNGQVADPRDYLP